LKPGAGSTFVLTGPDRGVEPTRISKCAHTVLFQLWVAGSSWSPPKYGIRGINRVKVPDSLKPSGVEEERLFAELDANKLPQHVAVIMDGNGRWAQLIENVGRADDVMKIDIGRGHT